MAEEEDATQMLNHSQAQQHSHFAETSSPFSEQWPFKRHNRWPRETLAGS